MLTFEFDSEIGEWRASLDNYYHAIGDSKDVAVKRLEQFLFCEHPGVFADRRPILDTYWKPAPGVSHGER